MADVSELFINSNSEPDLEAENNKQAFGKPKLILTFVFN